MIALDIQPYCQNCPDFDGKVTHECMEFYSIEYAGMQHEYKHVITCLNKERCEEMMKYLRQQRA